MMLENKVGCLPVLDENRAIIGIVTESDLFRYLAEILPADETEESAA